MSLPSLITPTTDDLDFPSRTHPFTPSLPIISPSPLCQSIMPSLLNPLALTLVGKPKDLIALPHTLTPPIPHPRPPFQRVALDRVASDPRVVAALADRGVQTVMGCVDACTVSRAEALVRARLEDHEGFRKAAFVMLDLVEGG